MSFGGEAPADQKSRGNKEGYQVKLRLLLLERRNRRRRRRAAAATRPNAECANKWQPTMPGAA